MSIKNGKYTIKDIAKYAGVATSTVSRVLNNTRTKISVTAKTREKIYEAVKKFEYSPDINAKRLSFSKSYTIGLDIPLSDSIDVFSDKTLMEMMAGMENAIIETSYNLLIVFRSKEYLENKKYLQLFKERRIDGLIVWSVSDLDNYSDEINKFPVIFTNTIPKNLTDINFIGHNNFKAEYDLTDYMIKKGARRFIYLSGTLLGSVARERKAGFLEAVKAHKLDLADSLVVEGDYSISFGFEFMDRILADGKFDFDAVIGANDNMALGVYNAALKHGKKIPQDFALAGGDGVDFFSEEYIPLTTFKVDCKGLGKRSINNLLGIIDGRISKPFQESIDSSLLIRKTA